MCGAAATGNDGMEFVKSCVRSIVSVFFIFWVCGMVFLGPGPFVYHPLVLVLV